VSSIPYLSPYLTYEELASIIFRSVGVVVESHQLSSRLMTFEDIGVDSLGVLSVIRELEHRRRIDLGTMAARDCRTPHQLMARVRDAMATGK
jgi:minimal PKS acyl carrier protein